ncbi:MAG: hypothetical protein R3350_05360 [Saprospiraceae bacterium]|nr:hypothetical protein [Saprospiraceae bacterium]
MRYAVNVNPAREREFLEFLRLLKKLKLVRSYESLPDPSGTLSESRSSSPSVEEKDDHPTASEFADQYRDLVD